MKFDFVIGNPPYQEEQKSLEAEKSLKNYAPPVYNYFMDAAFSVGEKVELITPGRFLFKAGSTPKAWNEKMLNDEHFKVLHYETSSSSIFSNTDIKGGIAITYRDRTNSFGAIKVFSAFSEVNSIIKKVVNNANFTSIGDIVFSRTSFRLTEMFHKDYPNAKTCLSEGHLYDMSSNIFNRVPFAFKNHKPEDGKEYIRVLGREDNCRIYKFIRKEYVNNGNNLDEYKLFVPQAAGTGCFGDFIATIEIGEPGDAATETFLSIGKFKEKNKVINLESYFKTKFFRCMLSTLKVTQIGNKPVYNNIPMQEFSDNSDIDWSKTIKEIDQQLYMKYRLSTEEINFIESHVKEMV